MSTDGITFLLSVRKSDLLDVGKLATVSLKSKPTRTSGPRVCGIADALGVVGDRWALLVLRELGFGVHRFNDIQANTGAPRDTLATRLRELEDAGLISRRRYSEHPPRDEYLLTDAGTAIGPALRELRIWGETYAR
jgi:DNA-binding HxlR family transcriptional regulator